MEDKKIMSVVSNLPIVVEVPKYILEKGHRGMMFKRNKVGW
jgi:hypothetical protein